MSDLLERRRLAATRIVGDRPALAARIAAAPAGYVLAHDSSDIVRHCGLLTPVPSPRQARVVVTPGREAGEWRLDVGSRDQVGLLAAFTGVLTDQAVDVVQAVLATWDDGAALQAFVVRSPTAPDSHELERAFEASLRVPLASTAVPDAAVSFNDDASELYTRCEVRAADQAGLLHAVAVAFAAAGADVHAARVTTSDGAAHDLFDVGAPGGGKLPAPARAVIADTLRTGHAGRARRRRRRPFSVRYSARRWRGFAPETG